MVTLTGVSARKRAKAYSFDAIKPGDIVVYTGYYGSEHYIFVPAIKDGYVYFGDANGVGVSRGCEIRSGKKNRFRIEVEILLDSFGALCAEKSCERLDRNSRYSVVFFAGRIFIIRQTRRISRLTLEQAPPHRQRWWGKFDNGTVVNVTEVNGSWGKITYKNITGWISLEYATCTAPTTCSVVVDVSEVKLSDKLNLKFSSDANVEYVVTVTVKNSVESLEASEYCRFGRQSFDRSYPRRNIPCKCYRTQRRRESRGGRRLR